MGGSGQGAEPETGRLVFSAPSLCNLLRKRYMLVRGLRELRLLQPPAIVSLEAAYTFFYAKFHPSLHFCIRFVF